MEQGLISSNFFADDESVVSSSLCEDPAAQNQIQSQDELTNPNPSYTMDTRENENVSILGSEGVAKKRSKNKKMSYQLCLRGSIYQWRR